MKTRVLYLFTSLVALISCTDEKVTTVATDSDEFYCSIENEELTRTSLDQNNNVIWSAEDQLVIFKKSSIPSKYQISESHIGKTFGSFYKINSEEFSAGSELDHNVALYPYKENLEITKLDSDSPTSSYEITGYSFPAEQMYAENSFANGAFPMAAVSDNYDLTFRNICGGIKLQLKGIQKVTSIKIEGKNSEKLAGDADIIVYSDETLKPAITMASNALTSVTLNCGAGVQLNESSATEFIVALPPMLFSKGFIVTVIDSEGKSYIIETDKANTIVRSSLLIMSPKTLGDNSEESDGDDNGDVYIPVNSISINYIEKIVEGQSIYLSVKITPRDATNQTITWSSDNSNIIAVSQQGEITGISSGIAKISASVDGIMSSRDILVVKRGVATNDYVDEYGINHGKGVTLGDVVWAPVNCGYKSATELDKGYPYGKLYQWGRKYGQGLGGNYDCENVELMEAPVSVIGGQSQSNQHLFYYGQSNWYVIEDGVDKLWNEGSEDNPQKNKYDPCPSGWRVPTEKELNSLIQNHSDFVSNEGKVGLWFSGLYDYESSEEKIFLPVAGWRRYGSALHSLRNEFDYYMGMYWSSSAYDINRAEQLYFVQYPSSISIGVRYYESYRALGCAVRCVQE